MGMFKRMKDMRDMVEAAPGMVAQAQQLGAQAQQLGAQAQQMAAAQQAAYQAQAAQAFGAQPGGFAEGADFDPIAGSRSSSSPRSARASRRSATTRPSSGNRGLEGDLRCRLADRPPGVE